MTSIDDAGSAIASLGLVGTPHTSHVDRTFLDEHRFPDGRGFPPSYREFVTGLGWGRLFGLWLVYPPVLDPYADGWRGRGGLLTERFRSAYRDARTEGFDWKIEPDGTWELVDDLVVFAWSENGDGLLWNTADRADDGELPVYLSPRFDSLNLLGPSLASALAPLREKAGVLAERAPADFVPLPPTKPIGP